MTESNQTVFGKILRGEIKTDRIYEDEYCIAFKDLQPQAPVHILVIPRLHIASLSEADENQAFLLGHLLLVAAKLAKMQGLIAWRTVINSGAEAGQTVFHLHLHVIGGRPLLWPPG